MTSRTLQTTSLLFALLCVVPDAGADPLTRATLRQELSGYEQAPTADEVRRWGVEGAALMIELANDTSEAPFLRARAVSGLRWFAPSEGVHTFLTQVAARAGDLFVRRAAFDALVSGYGDIASVAPMLEAPETDVRDGAAWAIGSVTTPAARTLLEARLRVETDPTVRLTLTTVLANGATARVSAVQAGPTVSAVRAPRQRRAP